LSASVAGETCCRPRYACVRACVRAGSKRDGVTTCKMGQATHKRQHATRDVQHATYNRRLATQHMRRDEMRDGTGDGQHTPCDMGHWGGHLKTGNGEQTSCNMQRTTTTCDATCNGQRASSKPQTTLQRQHATDDRQPGNGQQAVCGMRETPRKRRQATGNACNRQRASDSRRHARGREHMRNATGDTRHRRILCAASSGQRTTSSMREAFCTRQPVRNTAQTPHTRCNIRPLVPQHAANTHENTRGTTNEVRKLAHLGALSGSLRWTLGGGPTAR
jgi:hypothetical protein